LRCAVYADDFVILSRRKAAGALDWTRSVMSRIGLTLNEAKTHIRKADAERFDFLGYTFGPHRFRKDGYVFLGMSPSRKSVARLRGRVGDLMKSGNVMPWPEVRDRLNATLRGWSNYFCLGDRYPAYRAVNHHVYQRVRVFLRRRHKVPSLGTARFSDAVVFGKLGVLRLMAVAKSSVS
jgi:RNA-directed DNA polymerase